MQKKELLSAIAATYAAVGQEISDAALELITEELSLYPAAGVIASLKRCRRELRKISLAEILDRIPNGHPGPEEAWAMVRPALWNEDATIVLTGPMRSAFFAADELSTDETAARMAFREVYQRDLATARAERQEPIWSVILGHDKQARDDVLRQAVVAGKIAPKYAYALLANPSKVDLEELVRISQKVKIALPETLDTP